MLPRKINPVILIDDEVEIKQDIVKEISCPDLYSPWTIVSVFDGNISCTLRNDSGIEYQIDILQGVSRIEHEFRDNKIIVRFSSQEEGSFIHYSHLDTIYMGALPLDIADMKKIHHPGFMKSIGVNMKKALALAAGWEKIVDREIKIKYPDGHIITIRNSTENHTWKGDELHLGLPTVYNYDLKARYCGSESGWVGWSKWLKLRPKRKMSL